MRILYHFEQSVFSRRTRLALAHKGLEVELKDGRADAANLAAARALQPIRTMPVFVEDDGSGLGDSNAILQYLDVAYPEKPLLPRTANEAREALAIMTAIDVAMNAVVDLGTRICDLQGDAAWPDMKAERMARAETAIAFVAKAATESKNGFLVGDAWSAADIYAYATTRWVSAWPARVATAPQVAKMTTLGFTLPEALVAWSKPHDGRKEIRSIYG